MLSRSWLRPTLGVIAVVALAWAVLVMLTGGLAIRLGVLRVRSRDPVRALFLAVLFAVPYLRLSWPGQLRRDAAWLQHTARRSAPAAAVVLSLVTLVTGLRYGVFVAAGADPYGYVSQAELWEKGALHVPQPLASVVSWPNAIQTLSPLGYTPAGDRDIVPTYPPGLPLLMVVFRKVFGTSGQYYVVPALGALAVWLTFLLGRALTGRDSVAIASALVMAESPPFLFWLMWPMTDVPVAAAWTLAFLLALSESAAANLACGLTASIAVFIRPNLVPLAAVLVVSLSWRAIRSHGFSPRALLPPLLFCVCLVPGVAFVAALNNDLYGSPFTSGYGNLGNIYSLSNVPRNALQYTQWILQSGCGYVLVGILAAFIFWPRIVRPPHAGPPTRVLAAGLILVVVASYLLWVPFKPEEWRYLRFLLSFWPVSIVLAASLLLHLMTRIRLPAAPTVLLVLAAGISAHGARRADEYGAFSLDESRYVKAGEYIANHTEHDAVVLAMQHSGTVRYYGSRLTVRYDWLDRSSLDSSVRTLTRLGRHSYILLEDWEEPEFRRRFAKDNTLGRLDWTPIAEFPQVRLYDTPSTGGVR